MPSSHQETPVHQKIALHCWLLLLWFHMATWLWPIAPALQDIISQDQHHPYLSSSGTMPARPSTYLDTGAQWEFQMLRMEDGEGGQQPAKLQGSRCTDTRQDPNITESLPGQWLRSVSLG